MSVALDANGKVALVTGAAQGIGFAIAKELAIAGAKVAIADLDIDRAESAAQAICAETGAGHIGIAMNVADPSSIEAGLAKIQELLGSPDILVNNAGVYKSTPLLELEPDTWQLLIDIMLTGPGVALEGCCATHDQQQLGSDYQHGLADQCHGVWRRRRHTGPRRQAFLA